MAVAVAVADPEQVGGVVTMRAEEMMEQLKMENLALHGEVVVKKTTHARALPDNVCRQRDMKKVFLAKEKTAWLLVADVFMWENSMVQEQLMKDVLTFTMKAGVRIGTLTTYLEQTDKKNR